ncbi:MAG: helical backbone metal receptor [Acidobacteriota bacterium]
MTNARSTTARSTTPPSDRTAPPRRIVTTTCSNTEIVAALGCGDRLVGVDDYSDHPPELLAGLPRVGKDLDIDVEAVAALEPDLVLASLTVPGHEKVVARLEARGLPVVSPAPESWDDVERDVLDIAARLGVPERGRRVVEAMRAAVPAEPPPRSGSRPRVAVQWWPKPAILPGRRSWVHDLLARAGAENVLDEDVISRPVDDAELAALAPDVIVLAWCGVEVDKYRPDVVYRNPVLRDVPAVRLGRVVPISEAYLGRPSPRLVEGYRAFRRVFDAMSQDTDGPPPADTDDG